MKDQRRLKQIDGLCTKKSVFADTIMPRLPTTKTTNQIVALLDE